MNNLGNIWKVAGYKLLQKKAEGALSCQKRGQPIGVLIEKKKVDKQGRELKWNGSGVWNEALLFELDPFKEGSEGTS